MGLFEEQPWLMVPFILVVVAGYDLAKICVRRVVRTHHDRETRDIR